MSLSRRLPLAVTLVGTLGFGAALPACSSDAFDPVETQPAGGGGGAVARGGSSGLGGAAGGLAGKAGSAGKGGSLAQAGSAGEGGAMAQAGSAGASQAGAGGEGGGVSVAGAGGTAGGVGGGSAAGGPGSSGNGGSPPGGSAGKGGITAGGAAGKAGGALEGAAGLGGNLPGGGAGGIEAGGGGAGGNPDGGAGGASPNPCDTLYVSPTGSLGANRGCSPTTPLPTLGDALAVAKAATQRPTAIHVCRGKYQETGPALVLDINVSILGGYDCDQIPWTRPEPFARTAVLSTISALHGTLLTVKPGEPGPNVGTVVEGLRILPISNNQAAGKIGIHLQGGVSATVRSVDVDLSKGMEQEGALFGSVALKVELGSSARIVDNRLVAGPGVHSADLGAASVGLALDSPVAGFVLERNDVRGGPGRFSSTGVGSAGLVLTLASAPLVLTDNHFRGGTGTYTGGGLTGDVRRVAVGVFILPALGISNDAATAATIVGGSIDGGMGTSNNLTIRPVTRALDVTGGGANGLLTLTLTRVRVYGGDPSPSSGTDVTPQQARSAGIVARFTKLLAVSSLVHGGGAGGGSATAYPRAMELISSTLNGSFLTLVPGVSAASDGAPFDNGNAVGLQLAGPGVTVTLEDSMIVAATPNTVAVYAEGSACDPPADGTPYTVGLTRFAYVHPESAPGASSASGYFAGGPAPCPYVPMLTSASITAAGADSFFAVTTAYHVGSASGFQDGVDTSFSGCNTSTKCPPLLFPDYKGTPSEVLGVPGGYTPGCMIKSGIVLKTAKISPSSDLNGTSRSKATTLGAIVCK